MVNARAAVTPAYLTDTLPSVLPPIFEQAQHTTANHRKNIVALRKIQDACASVTEASAKGTKLVGEKAFNGLFVEMVNRVLGVKKGVAVADRVVKFVASYVAYAVEHDAASKSEGEEDVETATGRFVTKLLKHLLSGMNAKDKNVRFRVTLLTASMINGLGEMDDDMYVSLRSSLLERARDKEAAVRVQAALGLAKLQSGEDVDELEEGEESLSEVLLDLLRYDPAAEVRRAALYNLPRNAENLPHILARTRDIDPNLRRTVYHGSLSTAALPDSRVLSIAQREAVVGNGLGDREGAVRKAAVKMLGGWVDQAEGDLVEFLNRFDVVASQVAEDALLAIFSTRPDIYQQVEFDEEYWNSLTPEKAFLARDEARLEESLPVVTALAFQIQAEYNKLVPTVTASAEEAEINERAFIVGELMTLAVNLDYADEIGRRKMFQLAREMLSQENLPESLIPRCLDILVKISPERDLIRVVVDIVTSLREGEGDEDSTEVPGSQASSYSTTPRRRKSTMPRFDLKDPEEKVKADLVDMRALMICISLLERVNSAFQDNSVFHGLLPDLIIPAVMNKEEPALRDQGLICLGLCCIIDAKMAVDSFGLFVQQINAADDDLKVRVVQIVFDLLMVHDIQNLVSKTMNPEKVVELVRHVLSQEAPKVQAVACEGTAKLMLAGMITDTSILQSLVLLYFSPETADNQALRQCLTYFFPVYCYSSSENQRRMLSIFSETFNLLASIQSELEEDQEMLPLGQMGLMMVDWLDPLKAVESAKADHSVHLDLAKEIAAKILTEVDKEGRKALVSFFGKLNLPEANEAADLTVKCIALLINGIKEKRPLTDASTRNALNKFDAVLAKRYPESLDGFNPEIFAEDDRPEVQAIADMIDKASSISDEPVTASSRGKGSSKRGRTKRGTRSSSRSTSAAPTESDATTEAGSDGEETVQATPVRPRRSTAAKGGKAKMKVVEEDEEEEEEEEEEEDEEGDSDDVESILDDSF